MLINLYSISQCQFHRVFAQRLFRIHACLINCSPERWACGTKLLLFGYFGAQYCVVPTRGKELEHVCLDCIDFHSLFSQSQVLQVLNSGQISTIDLFCSTDRVLQSLCACVVQLVTIQIVTNIQRIESLIAVQNLIRPSRARLNCPLVGSLSPVSSPRCVQLQVEFTAPAGQPFNQLCNMQISLIQLHSKLFNLHCKWCFVKMYRLSAACNGQMISLDSTQNATLN